MVEDKVEETLRRTTHLRKAAKDKGQRTNFQLVEYRQVRLQYSTTAVYT